MLRRTPLFSALDRQLLSSGLQPDLHGFHKLLWEVAENVTFFSGKVVRRVSAAAIYPQTTSEPVRGLSQQQDTSGTRWLWSAAFGAGSIQDIYFWRWYGPSPDLIGGRFNISNADETSSHTAVFVDFTHIGDWTVINTGQGAANIHKPGIGVPQLADAPQNVQVFVKKLSFLLAVGYGSRGTRVGWSDADNIEEWTASETNLAGSLTIDDFDTRIKAAKPLGNSIAVYNEDQMALVNYIGGTGVFGFKFALDGLGASGKFSVASDGKSHYGVGRGGVWWTDGNTYRYIDEGFLHDYLQEQVNWGQQSKITACRNDFTGCFEFSFPMRGALEPNEAWSFDPRTGGWSQIPPFSLKDERRLFGKPVLGTSDGRVMRDQDNADAAAPLSLRTKPMLMQGDANSSLHVAARIDEVVLLLKSEEGVQFRLGGSHQIEGPYIWGEWVNCASGADTYNLGPSQMPPDGVWFKLDFRSTINNWSFDLQGFMLFGSVEGGKRDVA